MKKIITLTMALTLVFTGPGLHAQTGSELPAKGTAVVPAAEPVATVAPTVDANPDLITVDFSKADIQSVFKVLALKGNVNIVAAPEVSGEVTIQLKDVSWMNAFETIIRTYNFTYQREGNIYHVMTPAGMQQRTTVGRETEIISLEYANIKQVADALKKAISDSVVDMLPSQNKIMLTATPMNLKKARDIIAQIDRRMSQVNIDARIVRTALTKGENLGIDWSPVISASGAKRPMTWPFAENPDQDRNSLFSYITPNKLLATGQTAKETTTSVTSGGGEVESDKALFPSIHSFPYATPDEFTYGTIDFSQFSVMMSMLKNRSNTKVISNPRIVVIDHQEARVQAGREIGLPTFERNETTGSLEITGYEPRNDGIELKVTPHIAKRNEILLTVRPELSQFTGFQPVVTGSNVLSPEFETTVAETQVLVHSGDTLVIGGLISDLESDANKEVPYLSKIPLAGWLFKNKSPNKNKSETIIFVTVTLADDVFNRKAMEEWRAKQAEYEEFMKQEEESSDKNDDDKEKKAQEKQKKEDAKKKKASKKKFFWQKETPEEKAVEVVKEETKAAAAVNAEVAAQTETPKVEEPAAAGESSLKLVSADIKESAADAAEKVAAMIEESKNNPPPTE